MRFLKGLLYTIAGSGILIAVTIVYVTQVLDPNDLKPSLIDAANERDISLRIDGQISWSFYPSLAVNIDSVTAESTAGTFKAKRIEGAISLLSILSGTIILNRLIAIDPSINLRRSSISTQSPLSMNDFVNGKYPVAIRNLSLQNGEIRGLSPDLILKQITLEISDLNPSNTSEFLLKFSVRHRDMSLPIQIRSKITPNHNFTGITAHDLSIQSRQLKLNLDGYLSANLDGALSGEAYVEMTSFSLRNWLAAANLRVPVTRDLSRLTNLAFAASVKLSNEMISLQNLNVKFDDTDFTGNMAVLFEPLNANINLAVTSIDIDSYFSKIIEKNNLRKSSSLFGILPGAYKLDISSLTTNEIEFIDLMLEFGVSEDEVTLGRLDFTAFGGSWRSSGTHLLAPQITLLNGTVEEIELSKLPKNALFKSVNGKLNGAFDLRIAGRTAQEFRQSLSGSMRAAVSGASLQTISISDALCQVFGESIKDRDTVGGERAQLSIEFQEGIGVIDSLDATISNLRLLGGGRISLLSEAATLAGEIEIPETVDFSNCIDSTKLRGLRLPFSCRGNFDDAQFSCSLNESVLRSALQQKM